MSNNLIKSKNYLKQYLKTNDDILDDKVRDDLYKALELLIGVSETII